MPPRARRSPGQVAGFRVAFGFFAILAGLLAYPYLRVVTRTVLADVEKRMG